MTANFMQSTVAARVLARKNFLLRASQLFRQRNVLFHFSQEYSHSRSASAESAIHD